MSHAQTLAVLLTDLDGDGRRDILVGNDFATPDEAFLNKPEGWIDAAPFERTTAQLRLHTDGERYVREMRASSGYISSLPARVHFGLGDAAGRDVQLLEVVWPDGSRSQVDDPPIDSLLENSAPGGRFATRPLTPHSTWPKK